MATFISHSSGETEALGAAWGREIERGLIIGLSGDLGSGKTQLVKGLARGLDIPRRVHSPSFALVNIYTGGRLTLFHLDLYRLATPKEFVAAGLEEYLQPAGVTVIEWAERWFGDVPRLSEDSTAIDGLSTPGLRWVQIEPISETERRIIYEDRGP